jgi:hypothetical protein
MEKKTVGQPINRSANEPRTDGVALGEDHGD